MCGILSKFRSQQQPGSLTEGSGRESGRETAPPPKRLDPSLEGFLLQLCHQLGRFLNQMQFLKSI